MCIHITHSVDDRYVSTGEFKMQHVYLRYFGCTHDSGEHSKISDK